MKRNSLREKIAQKQISPKVALVYILLRLSVIMILIAQVLSRNYESVMVCVLVLILFLLPSVLERRLKIELPDTLQIIVLLAIYAAWILGEMQAFYVRFPFWDTMLHTLNGFLCAAVGFCVIDLLNRNSHKRLAFSLSPLYVAMTAFCFSMTVGVVWEFFEFFMDQLLYVDMQKDTIVTTIGTIMLDPAGATHPIRVTDIQDVIIVHSDGTQQALGLGGYLDIGLLDTMEDLFVNFLGAVVFSVVGYVYIKQRGKGKFARRFIPRVLGKNETAHAQDETRTEE